MIPDDLDLKLPSNCTSRPYFASHEVGDQPPTPEEDEFLAAVARFRKQNKHWPTATQYLWIATRLGYRRAGKET